WMDVLLHWVRTGQAVGEDRLFYGLLFGAYAAISAAFFQVVVLRRTHAAGQVLLGLVATFLVFIAARWAGDQWLLPLLGDEPNYPDHTGLWSFALDNVSYALVPMGVGALVHLFEVQVMAFRERAELAFRQRASELEVLRARMAPHFLFNTLNNLYALAQRPGADLSAPVHDLAQLMRYVAKHPGDVVALG
ncbi:MAG: histidine kinase, partial [Flavobacteriales bacterium]|nr:histidine kinase [Flavobacteriales bacterium]